MSLYFINYCVGHETLRMIEPKQAKQSLAVYDKGQCSEITDIFILLLKHCKCYRSNMHALYLNLSL